MSDYRYQPLTDQWVLIAGNRQERPNEYQQQSLRISDRTCPFCLGHEEQTPDAVSVYHALPDSRDWLVRVFPNKFPALTGTANQAIETVGPYQAFEGFGIHELIILSPRHVESFASLTLEERTMSLVMFQHRLRYALEVPEVRHAVIFQNCRSDAGASIQHVHCQLIATAIVPPAIAQRSERCLAYERKHHRTLQASLLQTELDAETRIVERCGEMVAFCPFASRLPYETWLVPQHPDLQDDFLSVSPHDLQDLGTCMQQIVERLEARIPGVAYNIVLHLPPVDRAGQPEHRGWHVEIFPRLNKLAGFEWATGCMINQVAPEVAAQHLRRA